MRRISRAIPRRVLESVPARGLTSSGPNCTSSKMPPPRSQGSFMPRTLETGLQRDQTSSSSTPSHGIGERTIHRRRSGRLRL